MEKMTVEFKGPKTQRTFKDLLGKFAQKNFYIELLEAVIREVLRSAALATCAAVTTLITRQITTDRNPAQQIPQQQFNDNDLRRNAYGNGQSYNNQSNYNHQSYTPVVPNNTSFPGFGKA